MGAVSDSQDDPEGSRGPEPNGSSSPASGDDPLDGLTIRALVGPTAVGKTALALRVAAAADCEIVSLDSMLVYRGLDIGTAKPSAAERQAAPHHLIDVVGPQERYDVQRYLKDVRNVLRELRTRDKRALFVGGTGFYLAALLRGLFEGPPIDAALRSSIEERVRVEGGELLHAELKGYDPEAAARIHPNDTKRLVRAIEVREQTGRTLSEWQREWGWHDGKAPAERPSRIVGLELERDALDVRIRERTRRMLDAGWADEAARIRDTAGLSSTAIQALGYTQALALADGELDRASCEEEIALRTRQFARRQRTWFKKFPSITWLSAELNEKTLLARAMEGLGW